MKTNTELKKSNETILEQQEALIEEERLKGNASDVRSKCSKAEFNL